MAALLDGSSHVAGLPFLIVERLTFQQIMSKTRIERAWVCAWATRKKKHLKHKQKLVYGCDSQHASEVKQKRKFNLQRNSNYVSSFFCGKAVLSKQTRDI